MNTTPSRSEAVERFINLLIVHARNGAIHDIMSDLKEGPPGRKPHQHLVDLHTWFQTLDTESQANIHAVVQEAVDSALFSFLVILDGAAGGYPLQGQLSDYALYLQAYPDDDAHDADASNLSMRLNPADATEDLHDIFMWMLEEADGASE